MDSFKAVKLSPNIDNARSLGAWDAWGPSRSSVKGHNKTHLTKRARQVKVTLPSIPSPKSIDPGAKG